MSIVDPDRKQVDVSRFVTYQSEELTTPTEKELIEDLPEWEGREAHQKKVEEKASKPRRGVGFLRAEPEPAETQEEASAESDFGAGLDEAELKAISDKNEKRSKSGQPRQNRPRKQPEARSTKDSAATGTRLPNDGPTKDDQLSTGATGTGEEKPKGRKRRRRRGRRNRKDSSAASQQSVSTPQDSTSTVSESDLTDAGSPDASGNDQNSKPAGEKRKPRRRRRRGGRNRSDSGNNDAPPPAAE